MKTLPYLAVGSNIGRMRTARLLTISQHALPGGVPASGGVPVGGCTCQGVGMYLPGGGVPVGGCTCWAGGGLYLLGEYLPGGCSLRKLCLRAVKMGRHFPVREKSGNFEKTGKVGENHTNYWKPHGISVKCYLFFFVVFE